MSGYAGPRGIALPVTTADWVTALRAARQDVDWLRENRGYEESRKGFWAHEIRRAMGYLCEIGFAAHRGVPWVHRTGIRHEPDVDGYEVKARAWPSARVMDDFEGGNYHIPCSVSAPVIVAMSVVEKTLTSRVFLDGWLRRSELPRFPLGGRPGDRRARVIPYVEFHEPRELP